MSARRDGRAAAGGLAWALARIVPALAVAVLAVADPALAGMDVSLEREFMRLQEIERQVEASPAYREAAELKAKLEALQMRFEMLAPRDPAETAAEREMLRRQIDAFERQLADLQKAVLAIREQASGGDQAQLYGGVANRLAVFTLDDPEKTGLGDPVSFLVSKKLLFSTRVSSVAVVNYGAGEDRAMPGGLAYFDRVDALVRDQGFLLALWGRLSRTQDGVRADFFLQVPAGAGDGPFARRVRLPEAMGSGRLTARLKPDRIALQSLTIDAEAGEAMRRAAAEVAQLRAEPRADAAVVGRLGAAGGAGERRGYGIVEARGEWVRLRFFDDGSGGWTSVDAFCAGACRAVLDAAIATNDMVALAAGLSPRPPPERVTRDAVAALQQMQALVAVEGEPAMAVEIAGAWAAGAFGPPPGGAGFANLVAVARVGGALDGALAAQPEFDRIRLPRETLAPIADDLARASVADPGDIDVVENLAKLFAAMDDRRRQALALEIAERLRTPGGRERMTSGDRENGTP